MCGGESARQGGAGGLCECQRAGGPGGWGSYVNTKGQCGGMKGEEGVVWVPPGAVSWLWLWLQLVTDMR